MKKNILFVTQVYYLDAALEHIKLLSIESKLTVIIEINVNSLKANVFNLSLDLKEYDKLTSFYEVIDKWDLSKFSPYFENCDEVFFQVNKNKKSISFESLKTSIKLIKFIKLKEFDYLHFDDFSLAQFGLVPFLSTIRRRIILAIHDPEPHLGESDWKINFMKKILFRLFYRFVVYSQFSKKLLSLKINVNSEIYVLKLLPYSIFNCFKDHSIEYQPSRITFIGRVSKYKGVDLLLSAIEKLIEIYPNQKFTIAGNPLHGYQIDKKNINSKNIEFIEKHLTNEDVASIISCSTAVICPYLEATQSGVILTAYALNCPVIVTPVGGLPEYVHDKITGIIAKETTAQGIADAMIMFLKNGVIGNKEEFLMKDMRKHNIDQINLIYS
jgi:glycosyltransferase involved in cell wall biosynthesis